MDDNDVVMHKGDVVRYRSVWGRGGSSEAKLAFAADASSPWRLGMT